MPDINEICCEGRLGNTPVIRVDKSSEHLSAEFSLYVKSSFSEESIRHDVKVNDHALADWVRKNLAKGIRVGVVGELSYESYVRDGKRARKAYINVFHPDKVYLIGQS